MSLPDRVRTFTFTLPILWQDKIQFSKRMQSDDNWDAPSAGGQEQPETSPDPLTTHVFRSWLALYRARAYEVHCVNEPESASTKSGWG